MSICSPCPEPSAETECLPQSVVRKEVARLLVDPFRDSARTSASPPAVEPLSAGLPTPGLPVGSANSMIYRYTVKFTLLHRSAGSEANTLGRRREMPIPMVSPAGMRLVKLLVGNRPQNITQLMEAAGVTRTAVTEQINELLAAGFVERTTERLTGRGRPRHLYTATDAALLLLFVGNQRMVVPAIWKAMDEIGGDKLKDQLLERVSRDLAKHYKGRITAKNRAERFRQMAKVLREEEGNLVDVRRDKKGRLLMERRSCSFFSMFEDSRTVCELDLRVLSHVVGGCVRRVGCRHDGDPCCVFEITVRKG